MCLEGGDNRVLSTPATARTLGSLNITVEAKIANVEAWGGGAQAAAILIRVNTKLNKNFSQSFQLCKPLKGTVLPDEICMSVVPLIRLEKDINC